MTDPLVTVYVPCRNYGRYLEVAVRSVVSQLYPKWELFIIDEASTDDTRAVATRLASTDPRITVIANDSPKGLQRVANDILARANGKYIVRLDADDWFDECALLAMVAKLEQSPNAGIVFGNYYYTSPDGRVTGTERRRAFGTEDSSGHQAPHGACTMVRTRSLKAVGGYSEDIDAQDGWELWYKLVRRVGAVSIDIPIFYYRQHEASLSRDDQRLLRARAKIFEKIAKGIEGHYTLRSLAVIGVRESYPGFQGVPYRRHRGEALLARAIRSVGTETTEIIVSSESLAVLEFAEGLERDGSVPPHRRVHRTHTASSVPIRETLLHAGEDFEKRTGSPPDIAAFLSVHASERKPGHVNKALHVLRLTESDSVVSVQEEREPVFRQGAAGLLLMNPGRLEDLAYDRERLFRFNGAILASWWDVLQHSLLGPSVAYVEMSAAESHQIKHPAMLVESDCSDA